MHELANQLTVINLNCFKLRGTIAKLLSGSSLDELERVEKAVVEMTNLVQSLHQVEESARRRPATLPFSRRRPTSINSSIRPWNASWQSDQNLAFGRKLVAKTAPSRLT